MKYRFSAYLCARNISRKSRDWQKNFLGKYIFEISQKFSFWKILENTLKKALLCREIQPKLIKIVQYTEAIRDICVKGRITGKHLEKNNNSRLNKYHANMKILNSNSKLHCGENLCRSKLLWLKCNFFANILYPKST